MLDIFKKDLTVYLYYIYATISARQGMVNVPHTKAAVDQRAGMNALFENYNGETLMKIKKYLISVIIAVCLLVVIPPIQAVSDDTLADRDLPDLIYFRSQMADQ